MVITGAERTNVCRWPQQIAKRLNLDISPDAQPEQGHYFRSDHFSFAHAGIPAFSIEHATEFAGKPAGYGQQAVLRNTTLSITTSRRTNFRPIGISPPLSKPPNTASCSGREIANQDKLPGLAPRRPVPSLIARGFTATSPP